jgi:hypothetical protein
VAKLLKVSKHSKDRLGYNNPKKIFRAQNIDLAL